MGRELKIRDVDALGYQAKSLMQTQDREIAEIQAFTLLNIAEIQHDIVRIEENAETQRVWIQANTARCLERMKLNTEETLAVISSASSAMSQTLNLYGGVGGPDFFEASVKSKVGGIFGKSCKITVTARRCNNFHYYSRGPAR